MIVNFNNKIDSKIDILIFDLFITKINYKMIARDYESGELVINFWSNSKAPYYNLSNFAFIEDGIEVDGIIYPIE